jgi:hypothetical protein
MKKKNNKNNPKNTNEQQLFLKTKNLKIRNTRKPSTPRAEEGYCNEPKRSRPSTHTQSHQPKHIQKYKRKTKNGLDKGSDRLTL